MPQCPALKPCARFGALIMASAFAENCELGTEEMHSGWLVKSPPLERTATTILKAVRMDTGR